MQLELAGTRFNTMLSEAEILALRHAPDREHIRTGFDRIWVKIADWICGTHKEEAEKLLFDLFRMSPDPWVHRPDEFHKSLDDFNKVRIFDRLKALAGPAHQDKFTIEEVVNEFGDKEGRLCIAGLGKLSDLDEHLEEILTFDIETLPYARALDQWRQKGPPEEREEREKAVRLLAKFYGQHESLCFYKQITSLPERLSDRINRLELTGCTSLKTLPEKLPDTLERLLASECHSLDTLPTTLPEKLRALVLCDTPITSLPSLPASLLDLNLIDCQLLKALPETLPNLRFLDLAGCVSLTSLPREFPASLEELSLKNCGLTSLPGSIFSLSERCEVNLEGNRFSEAVIRQISARVNAEGYHGPRIIFSMDHANEAQYEKYTVSDAVLDWYALIPGKEFAKTIWDTIGKEANSHDFTVFLKRLYNTVNSTNPVFREQIIQWLERLAKNPELRKEVFIEAKEGRGSCEDRVSLTFNRMKQTEIILEIHSGKYNKDLPTLIELARQQYRLQELDKIAFEKVQTLPFVDEVEVYLAYQVKLRDSLGLKIDTADMRFFGVSWVTESDLATAEKRVKQNENDHFTKWLASEWEPWQWVLKRLDPDGYETLESTRYEAKEAGLEKEVQRLLKQKSLPDTEPNRLLVNKEAMTNIDAAANEEFTIKFLQQQKLKL